ncbi:MAG: glycosyltransferase family 9 protein [Ignavibacteriae bacterium]|nr:glycosyltransferase family 9 protein [Ignavibacteriota bacterium]
MRRIEKAFTRLIFALLRLLVHVRRVRAIPRDSVRNILVIRQHNQLGDMLCAVPLFRALRATYPDARIDLLARPLNSEILRGAAYLDEVIEYDKSRFMRSPFAVWRFARLLKKRRYDLALVPSTVSMSVTSDMIAFLSGARRRIGPGSLDGKKNLSGFLYNVQVPLDWRRESTTHQTQRNLDIASILVLEPVPPDLEIGLSDDEIRAGREHLDKKRNGRELVIGFHPGAAKIPNRWDALRFAEIANRCAEIYGAYIVITAGPNDDDPLREMTLNMPNECLTLHNEPIRFVAGIIRHCDVFVTNDTGMMHVSAGVGTPTLSLFGPTDPLQWAPPGQAHRFILGSGANVNAITVDKVWAVLTDMLRTRHTH